MWSSQVLSKLSSYDELITGKTPALIIPRVFSKIECSSICSKILSINASENSSKFGTSLSSHIYKKSEYFSNAHISNKFLKKLFSENFSPLKLMHENISKIFQKSVSTAIENDKIYSDAIIRIHTKNDSVHLHRDNSNFEMTAYNVSLLKNQLSAILYLQSPEKGGELTIFNKMWHKKDECMRKPEFGYSSDLIKNVSKSTIAPVEGNMIILNPKFYHQIESISGTKSRISLGFFFGETSKNYLCSWT